METQDTVREVIHQFPDLKSISFEEMLRPRYAMHLVRNIFIP